MKYILILISILLMVTAWLVLRDEQKPFVEVIKTDPLEASPSSPYVAKVKLNDQSSVRLLILKHSLISMADGDAQLVVNAVNIASSRGLKIHEIGNHFFTQDGMVSRVAYGQSLTIDKAKDFVNKQMKIDAELGDTIVIFTVGHGFTSGDLQNLGQRRRVMKMLAECAEENSQETLWWQLSCHATARLPKISELNNAQQELFSMVASSFASETSAAGVQGKIMQKVFVAMAERSTSIDPDQDDTITAQELGNFLNSEIGRRRGELVFAKNPNEPIFGGFGLGNIPIVDRNNPNRQFPRNYIPPPIRP